MSDGKGAELYGEGESIVRGKGCDKGQAGPQGSLVSFGEMVSRQLSSEQEI